MMRLHRAQHPLSAASLGCLAALCLLPSSAPAQSSIIANAPIKNFRLPSFNEQGNRVQLLRGSEARYVSTTQIDIIEMNFTEFRGDGSTDPVNMLLAPSATVFVKEKNQVVITGQQSVRLIGNGVEATGENWTYDHNNNHRLILTKNVRVVFDAPLKGILD
jgi:hypothetical protein